jgi:hypothetical protein
MKTISFSPEEEQELLAILPNKYKDRINHAYSFYIPSYEGFISPGLPDWSDKLPDKLDIGRKIEVIKDSWNGKSGIITNHYINGDNCGDWGKAYYQFHAYGNSGIYSVRVENCKFID